MLNLTGGVRFIQGLLEKSVRLLLLVATREPEQQFCPAPQNMPGVPHEWYLPDPSRAGSADVEVAGRRGCRQCRCNRGWTPALPLGRCQLHSFVHYTL